MINHCRIGVILLPFPVVRKFWFAAVLTLRTKIIEGTRNRF